MGATIGLGARLAAPFPALPLPSFLQQHPMELRSFLGYSEHQQDSNQANDAIFQNLSRIGRSRADGVDLRILKRLRSEEHTSELQSHLNLVCRLLLEKKNQKHGVSPPPQPAHHLPTPEPRRRTPLGRLQSVAQRHDRSQAPTPPTAAPAHPHAPSQPP